jgi:hypothetical protein
MPELLATILARAGMLLLEAVLVRVVKEIFVFVTKPKGTAAA